ncbi:MAG: hypothetical protein HY815_03020 [Candidatus Riflebacteria bacterium]|nr:hypothetical protein [Candidatus Riflebacteria bacterium]
MKKSASKRTAAILICAFTLVLTGCHVEVVDERILATPAGSLTNGNTGTTQPGGPLTDPTTSTTVTTPPTSTGAPVQLPQQAFDALRARYAIDAQKIPGKTQREAEQVSYLAFAQAGTTTDGSGKPYAYLAECYWAKSGQLRADSKLAYYLDAGYNVVQGPINQTVGTPANLAALGS